MDRSLLDKSYYTRNFVSTGMPKSNMLQTFFSEKNVRDFNQDRYNWYLQMLQGVMNPSSKGIVDTVLTIEQNNRVMRDRVEKSAKEMAEGLQYILNSKTEPEKKEKFVHYLNGQLGTNPLTKNIALSGGSPTIDNGPSKVYEAADKEIVEPIKKPEDVMDDNIKNKLIEYNNNPITSPKNELITGTDRIVFIATTFILRALSLFMVQWALNTYMVRSFQGAFKLYIGCYISLFMLWVTLTNASRSILFFRMLFFYVSTTPNGYGRVIVHLLVQLLFLPIPFIVQDQKMNAVDTDFTYEKRRSIQSTVSNFTFFMWLLTSVIAAKY
jgi:uncharacterized membrane protein